MKRGGWVGTTKTVAVRMRRATVSVQGPGRRVSQGGGRLVRRLEVDGGRVQSCRKPSLCLLSYFPTTFNDKSLYPQFP